MDIALHSVFLLSLLLGQDSRSTDERAAAIQSNLVKAEADYKEAIDNAKRLVLEALDAKEQEARATQDLSLLDKVRTEKAKFLRNEAFPSTINMNEYHVSVAIARANLMKAYLNARNEFTGIGRLYQAKNLDAELSKMIAKARLGHVPVTNRDLPESGNESQAGDEDPRTLWVHSEGYFIRGIGKDWLENWDFGRKQPFIFTETQRNPNYIEITRRPDQSIIRLYSDRALIKWPQKKTFELLYEGKWQKQGQ